MRKATSINFDTDKLAILDQYIIRPCSRSDLINDIVGYILQSPYVLETFVKLKLDELNNNALLTHENQ